MPNRPKHECPAPGCHVLVSGKGRCAKHRTDVNRARGSAASRGYGSRWRKVRAIALSREPLCRDCAKRGLTVASECVDHIVPMARGGEQYDLDNLQGLCVPCHSTKTATEDGGFGT